MYGLAEVNPTAKQKKNGICKPIEEKNLFFLKRLWKRIDKSFQRLVPKNITL